MRILHFISLVRAEIGGPITAVVDVCEALARRGHEVTLVTVDGPDAPAAWRNPTGAGPKVVELAPGVRHAIVCSRGSLNRVRELIAQHDVVHVHGLWEYPNIQVCRIAKKLAKPYFVSVHGMLDDWCMAQRRMKKRLYLSLLGRKFLEGAAGVHLTAAAEKDQSIKWFPHGRPVVIPNLLDLATYEQLPGPAAALAKFGALRSRRPTVLYLSRIHIKKGLERLLRAVKLLKDRGTPCALLIAGGGDEEYVASIKRLVQQLGLTSEDVSFLGMVMGELKLSLYEACDVFALATSQENFGFVFVESLACGTPVLTTRGVDIWPELETSGGAVIAEGTPEAFANALGSLLSRREELPEMGRKGREWVFRDLNPENVLDQFEAMYRSGG